MRDLSNLGASANILKGLIGLGVLNLPYATKQVGWLASVAGMVFVAWMTSWGIFFAVMSKQKLSSTKQKGAADAEASELDPLLKPSGREFGLGCFDTVVSEVLGWPGQWVWVSSVTFCQFGTAVAYVTVIAQSVEQVAFNTGQEQQGPGPMRLHVLCLLGALLAVLSVVKRLKGVAYLSCVGLLTYVLIFGILVSQAYVRGSDATAAAAPFARFAEAVRYSGGSFIRWFGITAFAFGGLPIAMAVLEDMRHPEDFYFVTGWSFAATWFIYACFGVLGYLCYGKETNEIIHFNFPPHSWAQIVCVTAVGSILTLSYPLQMMPVFNCAQHLAGDDVHYVLLRTLLVICTIVVAHLIPSTAMLISVCGAFAAAVSSFMLPPLVYLNISPRPPMKESVVAYGVIVLGSLGAAAGVAAGF